MTRPGWLRGLRTGPVTIVRNGKTAATGTLAEMRMLDLYPVVAESVDLTSERAVIEVSYR